MAKEMILPALGMAQESGKVVRWLKPTGTMVLKGEPVVEIETDKATLELEAPEDGVLHHLTEGAGEELPVGQVIARLLAPGEAAPISQAGPGRSLSEPSAKQDTAVSRPPSGASPLAARIAAEHNLDLAAIKPAGRRIQKADVLAHLQERESQPEPVVSATRRKIAASPKARRSAVEQHKDLASIRGSGPGGAVLYADVLAAPTVASAQVEVPEQRNGTDELAFGTIWRIMAERTTQSWTSMPHFFLVREVNVSRLVAWRKHLLKRLDAKITYTDLLVKIVATALHEHPRLNASWQQGKIILNREINIGLAAASEEGLVVPVLQRADTLSLQAIAEERQELIARVQAGKLRPQDMQNGTFTISNLGMYGVDAFNAIINPPQAAILAVGRIVERVVPVDGQIQIQPMMTLTLSCDHRVVDGARGAQFLGLVAELLEEPLGLVS